MTKTSVIHKVRLGLASALVVGIFCATFPPAASAAPLAYAGGFNVFTFGSLHSASDIGGRAAAGSTVGGTFEVGSQILSRPSTFDLVTGTGVEIGSQVKVNSQGKAFVPNGAAGSNVLMNGGGALVTAGAPPIDFNAARDYFYELSGALAALDATGFFSGGALQATSLNLNVFNLTAAEFLNLTNIQTEGGTVVINVGGAPGLSAHNMTVNGVQNTAGQSVASKILFNFYQDYGTLALPNAMGGSVLAPFATVTGTNQYNGTIIAAALDFNGEIHGDGEFDGDPLTPTPEPATLGVAGTGLLLVLGSGYRAKRKRKLT